jgi:lipid-binding SYLF domain-containing protein
MKHSSISNLSAVLIGFAILVVPLRSAVARGAELARESRMAVRDLAATNAGAHAVWSRSAAALVFPHLVSTGGIFDKHEGEGTLIDQHTATQGHYKTVADSYGFDDAKGRTGYVLFFLDAKSLSVLHQRGGWEVGRKSSVNVVDHRYMSEALSAKTPHAGIYAFGFNEHGFLPGLKLRGTKITEFTVAH